jgi:hypothetical protein
VYQDGKGEVSSVVVSGLAVELQRLEASERGLAEAYDYYERNNDRGPGLSYIAQRHRRHAGWLAERMRELGIGPLPIADQQWVSGPAERVETLVYAEHAAARTYHDHLGDFDSASLALIRDRILPEQEQTLAELTGGPAPAGFSMEP